MLRGHITKEQSMSSNHKSSQSQWGSRVGFILAATGSAVGLGNIWKFPYMTGENGGAGFLLVLVVHVATPYGRSPT